MRRLSDKISQLIQQCWLSQTYSSKAASWNARLAMAAISKCGEVAAVPYLLTLLIGSDEEANLAADAISELLRFATPEELLDLEEDVRWKSRWELPVQWGRLRPDDLRALVAKCESQLAVLGVLSWHPSGFVREVAVRALAELKDASAASFLLLRMNDWVEPVRRAAEEAVRNRLESGRFDELFEYLYLALRLLDCQRADHSPIVMRLVGELTTPQRQQSLLTAVHGHSPFVRRRCYQLAMATDGSHRPALVRSCLTSDDPTLRVWASRDARNVLPHEELEHALQRMSKDSLMPVRREFLLALIERFPERAAAALLEALLEPGISMREFARFHLRKRGVTFSAKFYREAIDARHKLLGAVAGLGEIGNAEDADTLTPLLKDKSARLRAAATRAIGRLSPALHVEALRAMLRDPSKKVVQEAQAELASCVDQISIRDLWSDFDSGRVHSKLAVLNLLAERCDIWATMPYLIQAAADADPGVAGHAQHLALRRSNHVFTRPTTQQSEEIRGQLEATGNSCPKFAAEFTRWFTALAK